MLPVRPTERQGDWARALCCNGWSAWVDGRLLITAPLRTALRTGRRQIAAYRVEAGIGRGGMAVVTAPRTALTGAAATDHPGTQVDLRAAVAPDRPARPPRGAEPVFRPGP